MKVNDAGISGSPKPTDQVSGSEWDRGQSINVSSIAGLFGVGGIAPYHTSKGAVRMMSENDAITYAPDDIRVNSIHPGHIGPTNGGKPPARDRPGLGSRQSGCGAAHSIGHMGKPNDIAWAVVWPASDEAKFVTGAGIVIDGGYTAR